MPLDGAGGHLQRGSARRGFQRLEVEIVGRAWAYERFDFLNDLGLERRLEAPFLAS